MTSLNFQFHAEPRELLFELIPQWFDGLEVYLVAERFFPEMRRVPSTLTDLHTAERELETISRVLVRLSPFQSQHAKPSEFFSSNPDFLDVLPGRLGADGLSESRIGAVVEEPASLKAWKRVFARAKKPMHRGAVLINPMGDRFEDKHHAFTDGALRLFEEGTPMLAIAGGVRYELVSET